MPRFTIVVPTRNRADLFLNAIQSILEQSFTDLEVLLSNNSDDDFFENVNTVVASQVNDPRVKVIRPPQPMSMTDHWEWAVGQATGDYVGILTDRMLLRLDALSQVNPLIGLDAPPVIAFERANLIEVDGKYAVPPASMDTIVCETKNSADLIASFQKSDFSKLENPRFLNGFASSNFLQMLRETYGSVFTGVSPDYGFLMRVLDQVDQYKFISNPFLIKHSDHVSNGKGFTSFSKRPANLDFLKFLHRDQTGFQSLAPIPEDLTIIVNGMMREYETGRVGSKRRVFPEYDRQAFYNESIRHSLRLKYGGADTSEMMKTLDRFRKDNGLVRYSISAKQRVKEVKTAVRKYLGLKHSVRRPATWHEPLFATMIEALRHDAISSRPESSSVNDGFLHDSKGH